MPASFPAAAAAAAATDADAAIPVSASRREQGNVLPYGSTFLIWKYLESLL